MIEHVAGAPLRSVKDGAFIIPFAEGKRVPIAVCAGVRPAGC
jgi:hypothetical protein